MTFRRDCSAKWPGAGTGLLYRHEFVGILPYPQTARTLKTIYEGAIEYPMQRIFTLGARVSL